MNSNNSIEFSLFDPNEKKTDGRKKINDKGKGKAIETVNETKDEEKKSRGTWTEERVLVLLASYRDFRPYGVGHGQRTKQWMLLTDAVNKKNPELAPLGKQSVISKLTNLIDQYKGSFTEIVASKCSGSNHFSSEIERQAYLTWQTLIEDENASKEEKSKKVEALENRERLKKDVMKRAVEGERYQKKRKLDDTPDIESDVNRVMKGGPFDPIEIDVDQKLISDSQRNHQELLAVFQEILAAIKAMHQDLVNKQ